MGPSSRVNGKRPVGKFRRRRFRRKPNSMLGSAALAVCCRPAVLSRPILPAVPPGDLLAYLDQVETALRARDDFLAVAAHELRSPLHALGLRMAMLERMAA